MGLKKYNNEFVQFYKLQLGVFPKIAFARSAVWINIFKIYIAEADDRNVSIRV